MESFKTAIRPIIPKCDIFLSNKHLQYVAIARIKMIWNTSSERDFENIEV